VISLKAPCRDNKRSSRPRRTTDWAINMVNGRMAQSIRMAVDAAYQRQEIASHASVLDAMTTGFARQLTAATLALAKEGSQE
jgi:predicted outer membrane protein